MVSASGPFRRALAPCRALSTPLSKANRCASSRHLRFFASAYGLDRTRSKQRIAWALEAFELAQYGDTSSRELPLGYKQRLAMTDALMHEPDILFLDEPTSGVDPLARGTPVEMKVRFRSNDLPDPTMEDAFIGLIEAHERSREAAA